MAMASGITASREWCNALYQDLKHMRFVEIEDDSEGLKSIAALRELKVVYTNLETEFEL